MTDRNLIRILTINRGSSSIKFSLYRMGSIETQMLSGSASGIGLASGLFHIKDTEGKSKIERKLSLRDRDAALHEIISWLHSNGVDRDVDAVGHRLVHGEMQLVMHPCKHDDLMMYTNQEIHTGGSYA